MEAATDAAVSYLKRTYHEVISKDDIFKMKGCYKQGIFYAFKFKRMEGTKASHYRIVIVEKLPTGFNVVKDVDSPTTDDLKDPFNLLDGFVFRSPVPLEETLTKNMAYQFPPRNPSVSVNVGQPKGEDEFKKMGGGG